MSLSREQHITEVFKKLGVEGVGFARLERPISLDYYVQWLDRGMSGSMNYLRDHLELKSDPEKVLGSAGVAIVLTRNYVSHPWPQNMGSLPIAAYAKGRDYHVEIHQLLHKGIGEIQELDSSARFVPFVDSGPVMERDLAYRAGLGWVGKNTCLIHEKRGSLFFISSIYTNLNLSVEATQHEDRCGTCTRCIDACPTQAIVDPRVLDARRCISYWTIEAKTNAPATLRSKMDWFFGCDICQTVCPWNQKVLRTETPKESAREELLREVEALLKSTHSQIEKRFKGTPLLRARPWAHKRNAIVLAANKGLIEALPWIRECSLQPRLQEVALWAIDQLEAPTPIKNP